MPYLPEEIYAGMRKLSMFRDQLTEDRIRNINRLHRELKIYFPEYMDAFGKNRWYIRIGSIESVVHSIRDYRTGDRRSEEHLA